MARMIEIDFDPAPRTLRHFGFIALGGFGVLAALAFSERLLFAGGWLGEARVPLAATLLGIGVFAALCSVVAPRANRLLFVGLSLVAFPIGFVLSYVILGVLFFAVITPIGLALRALGHDPLERRFEPDAPTYWVPSRAQRPAESYFKQF